MEENKVPLEKDLGDHPVIFDSWEEFWNYIVESKIGIKIPVSFFYSFNKDLNIKLMSVIIANVKTKTIEEILIQGVSQEKYIECTEFYKNFLFEHYSETMIKEKEDI